MLTPFPVHGMDEATLILFAQFLELYVMVGPAVGHGEHAAAARLPWVELAATVGFLGLFTLVFGWGLGRHDAVPLKDPALAGLGFLTLGLLGGFGHCAGMCSPFVLFVSRRYAGPGQLRSVRSAQISYTAGRVATYAGLGAIAGTVGGLVQLAGALVGLQRGAAIVAGSVLVVWTLASLLEVSARRPPLLRLQRQGAGGWFARVARVAHRRALGHPAAMGLLLGLLPCGLVYSALIAASARGTALGGALGLGLFGLGTTPALVGVSLADTVLARNRATLNGLAPAFALVMGAWFIWRGLVG